MLQFFRKYQMAVFIVTASCVVLSFLSYGVGTVFKTTSEKIPAVGVLSNGEEVFPKTLYALTQILQANGEHPISDGWLEREWLFQGPLETLLLERKDLVAAEVRKQLSQIVQYTPYQHPNFSFLGVKDMWRFYAPGLLASFERLQKWDGEQISDEHLKDLANLFCAQVHFPPHLLKTQLYQYGTQMGISMTQDPFFVASTFSLPGGDRLSEWFGESFTQLLAQVILEGAVSAQDLGFEISQKEAHQDMVNNIYQSVLKYLQGRGSDAKAPTLRELDSYYNNVLSGLGLGEAEAVDLWQKVLSCKAVCKNLENSVILDHKIVDQFYDQAHAVVETEWIKITPEAMVDSFEDLLLQRWYLEKIGAYEEKGFFPSVWFSAEEVASKCPSFVYQTFTVRGPSVSREEILADIAVVFVLEWQIDEVHFSEIHAAVPSLPPIDSVQTRSARYNYLEALQPRDRQRVDRFAQEMILKAMPERITTALRSAPVKEEVWEIPLQGKVSASLFDGKPRGEELISFLEKIGQESEQEGGQESGRELSFGSNKIMRIDDVVAGDLHVFSFAALKKRGVLAQMLEERLEAAFTEFSPCLWENDTTANVKNKREELTALLFSDFLMLLDQDQEVHSQEGYVKKWRDCHLSLGLDALQEQRALPWGLVKEPFVIGRNDPLYMRVAGTSEGQWLWDSQGIFLVKSQNVEKTIEKSSSKHTKHSVIFQPMARKASVLHLMKRVVPWGTCK